MALSWVDPEIAEQRFPRHSYITLGGGQLNPDLRPDVFMINDVASENDRNLVSEEIYAINPETGTVVNNRRMRGTFRHCVALHSFPFDMHSFVVQFYFHPCYDIVGPVDGISTSWWGRQGNSEFDIGDKIVDRFSHTTSDGSGITFESYEFEIRVARKYTSYLWNIGIVVECLFLLGLSVLMLDTASLGDRIDLTMVLVLAYSAFKIMVASMVPALGYMTLLDTWVMAGFCFGAGAGIASMASHFFELSEDEAILFNRGMGWVSVSLWLLLHVVLLCRSGLWQRRRFLAA
mmetsp:Transcript_148476/g.458798  ORF Transcript_148476/g.458798 Transcript_148476/m.458798 type:complete len:290 (+) Transcript_148476:253-1122(+)